MRPHYASCIDGSPFTTSNSTLTSTTTHGTSPHVYSPRFLYYHELDLANRTLWLAQPLPTFSHLPKAVRVFHFVTHGGLDATGTSGNRRGLGCPYSKIETVITDQARHFAGFRFKWDWGLHTVGNCGCLQGESHLQVNLPEFLNFPSSLSPKVSILSHPPSFHSSAARCYEGPTFARLQP